MSEVANEHAVKCSATGPPNKEKNIEKAISIIQMQIQPDMYNYVH